MPLRLWFLLHPHETGGWRWAIHVKEPTLAAPLDGCLMAAHQPTRRAASIEGERALNTSLALCRVLGMLRPTTTTIQWDTDPFAGRNLVPVDTPDGHTIVPL
jgi:hypothetical protein